jgi:hypothetical protein
MIHRVFFMYFLLIKNPQKNKNLYFLHKTLTKFKKIE